MPIDLKLNLEDDVCVLGLGTRAENALCSRDIIQVKDLLAKTGQELLTFPGLGPDTLKDINRRLAKHKLALKG